MNSQEDKLSGSGPAHVRRVYVEDLFGHFNYDLFISKPNIPPTLLILYGDNGCGKTTLLQMVFHLLNPERKGGHKSFLAKRIFKRFELELTNGTLIAAERPAGRVVGGFLNTIRDAKGKTLAVEWLTDEDGDVQKSSEGEDAESEFWQAVAGLRVELYLLTDDRTIASTSGQKDAREVGSVFIDESGSTGHVEQQLLFEQHFVEHQMRPKETDSRAVVLQRAIGRASTWVTQQVIAASSKGEEDANAIYTDIVQRLARLTARQSEKRTRPSRAKLMEALQRQATRSANFSRYGLVAPTNINTLIESIRGVPLSALVAIQDVIKPYVEGLQARLDALQGVHDRLDSFVSILNSFYTNKTVKFAPESGFLFVGPAGERLPPKALSSARNTYCSCFAIC